MHTLIMICLIGHKIKHPIADSHVGTDFQIRGVNVRH